MDEKLTIRQATIKDADILFYWRNDHDTRKASHHSKYELIVEDHVAWLSNSLVNIKRKLLIAEENGEPVGTVRADLYNGEWELSWTVDQKLRGNGIGKRMVSLLVNEISGPIRAEIKKENIASSLIAEYVGMIFNKEINGIYHYRSDKR